MSRRSAQSGWSWPCVTRAARCSRHRTGSWRGGRRSADGRPPGLPHGARARAGSQALVALSRDRERLHRRLPVAVPVYVERRKRRGGGRPLRVARCRASAAKRSAPGFERRRRGPRSSCGAPPRTRPRACCRRERGVVERTRCPRLAPLPAGSGRRALQDVRPPAAALHASPGPRGGELRVDPAGTGGRGSPRLALRAARPGTCGRGLRHRSAPVPPPPGSERRAGARAGGGGGTARRLDRGRPVRVLVARFARRLPIRLGSRLRAGRARQRPRSCTRWSSPRAEGARSFDFLRGSEPYKYRFGARDHWDRHVARAAGARAARCSALRDRARRLLS